MIAMKERSRRIILLLKLYMFLYKLVQHVVDIQVLLLQGEWEKIAIWSLTNESMGQHMESRTGIRISRPLVVGFMDR